DHDSTDRHRLVCGANPHQITLMRAAHGPAVHDLVSCGKLILKGHMQVGEGRAEQGNELFDAIATAHLLAGAVPTVVRGDEGIDDSQVAPVKALPPTIWDKGLRFFG